MSMHDTGEIIKVYTVNCVETMTQCPMCEQFEDDRVAISDNERYCYCFECAIEWIARGDTWEGK